jgi:hypothetical protein
MELWLALNWHFLFDKNMPVLMYPEITSAFMTTVLPLSPMLTDSMMPRAS